MEYVTVKSYDGKLVRIKEEKVKEYLEKQEEIKMLLKQGKTKEEIRNIINEQGRDNRV